MKNQCLSIKSNNEPHLQCLLYAEKDNKYCSIHLLQKKIIDYIPMSNIVNKMPELQECNNYTTSISDTNDKSIKINKLTYQIDFEEKKIQNNISQNKENIINSYKENEKDLEIDMFILLNDESYSKKLPELIGPVFYDITLSEDEFDLMTMDQIWTIDNGIKIPTFPNKYFLFSYEDSHNKIRCFTVFTLYELVKNNNFRHPTTNEELPIKTIKRAKKLIKIYLEELNIFDDHKKISDDISLKNKVTNLFRRIGTYNIFLEESWFLSINEVNLLKRIIIDTNDILSKNLKNINPNIKNINLFKKIVTKKDSNLKIKSYIVDEWEKLLNLVDLSLNKIPLWILIYGLYNVIPIVKEKYPNLNIMN